LCSRENRERERERERERITVLREQEEGFCVLLNDLNEMEKVSTKQQKLNHVFMENKYMSGKTEIN